MKIKKWLSVSLISLCVAGIGYLSLSAYTEHDMTRNLETMFAVFRDAMLLDVDEPDPEMLTDAGILGMLKQLDPYTEYIPERSKDNLKFITTGEYAGIGALIQKAGEFTQIAQVYENTPALRAGLKTGDTLVEIDGVSLKGISVNDVSAKLKGKENSKLIITVNRPFGEKGIVCLVKRAKIQIPAVAYSTRLANDIAYVNLSSFTTGCAKDILHAIEEIKNNGDTLKGLVLDLRGNVGGLFNEAIDLVSLFVTPGSKVVEVKGRGGRELNTHYASGNAPYRNIPLVVLVNRESASSSEVVAGALQDLDRAIIIGEQTFGKGLVQTTRPLPYGGIFKITTAKYYTPSGRCIQAIDYAQRSTSGIVDHIPDSLMKPFKTLNGRIVYDGGGIWPDITIKAEEYSPLVSSLFLNGAFFDFANKYQQEHDSLGTIDKFHLSDEEIYSFITWVRDKKYLTKNPLFDLLTRVEKMSSEIGLNDSIVSKDFLRLRGSLLSNFRSHYQEHLKEVREILEQEIVSRYYFRSGRIAHSLPSDKALSRGIELLLQRDSIQHILHEVSPKDLRKKNSQENKTLKEI